MNYQTFTNPGEGDMDSPPKDTTTPPSGASSVTLTPSTPLVPPVPRPLPISLRSSKVSSSSSTADPTSTSSPTSPITTDPLTGSSSQTNQPSCGPKKGHSTGIYTRFLYWFLRTIRKILVKYWIWMVALMLMFMSFSGDKVVIYRICYMFLFLTFLVTFHLSYGLWRRMLFPFLLMVMFYSFLVCATIYSYQFTLVRNGWSQYLYVSDKLQKDLGLKVYDSFTGLFIECSIPITFILITFIQLNSFHKEFMELTRIEDKNPSVNVSGTTRRTTLPTLIEEHEPIIAYMDEEPLSSSSSGGSAHHTTIEMDQTPELDVTSSTSRTIPSPARESVRSISFSVKERVPVEKRKSALTVESYGKRLREGASISIERSHSMNDSPNKRDITRRKTLSEIAPVKMENLKSAATDIKEKTLNLWETAQPGINEAYELVWRFVEMHMMKVVHVTTVFICVSDVSAVNFLFVFLLTLIQLINGPEKFFCSICSVWASVIILLNMVYQLDIKDWIPKPEVCSYVSFSPGGSVHPPFNDTGSMDLPLWIGFKDTPNLFPYIGKYLLILLALTINSVVSLRQKIHRSRQQIPHNPSGLLFLKVTRKDADKDVAHLLKYLVNYGFYKFGLEVTMIMMVITIGSRKDVIAFLFSLILMATALCSRKRVQCFWPMFTLLLTILIPFQYLSALGIPAQFCIEYPWYESLDPEIRNWVLLPDYRIPPDGKTIIYDFIVLLFASKQWGIFKLESILREGGAGGSNMETFYDQPVDMTTKNETPDYTIGKSLLDNLKSYFFSCFYWVTLAVVFLTATGRTNLFGLGYILGCFFFLWSGSEFYLKPLKTIMRHWKLLIAYCSIVIMMKTVLHIVGCVESASFFEKYCWVSKLLGIICDFKIVRTPDDSIAYEPVNRDNCVMNESTSLLLDAFCLLFLLIQKRIFGSYYFTYLVTDIKAQQVLASRGAELIHEIQAKEVAEQEDAEKDVMVKIKLKVDRIRAYQASIKMGALPSERKSHRQAVRSGDYYLFDDPASEDADIDLDEKPRRSMIPDREGEELRRIANVKGISAFMSQLLKGELEQEPPLEPDVYDMDLGESSKDSAIVSIDREIEVIDPDASQVTIVTTVPTESTATGSQNTEKSILESDKRDTMDIEGVTVRRRIRKSVSKGGDGDGNGDPDGDDDGDEAEEEEVEVEEEMSRIISFWIKIIQWFTIMCWFIESCVISATAKLNHVSRDYRYVSCRLAVEKRALKVLFEMENAEGVDYGHEWKRITLEKISRATVPRTSSTESFRKFKRDHQRRSDQINRPEGGIAALEVTGAAGYTNGGDGHGQTTNTTTFTQKGPEYYSDFEEDDTFLNSNAFIRLFRSLFYTIVSQSEIVCYAMVILNHLANATLISLPLPIMVFLWGCMSVPRPSKTFWISLITYTEAVVVAKYIFSFSVWPWVDYSDYSPKLVNSSDVKKSKEVINMHIDLALLLFLFFHRFMLKSLGLWDLDMSNDRVRMPVDNSLSTSSGAVTGGDQIRLRRQERGKGPKAPAMGKMMDPSSSGFAGFTAPQPQLEPKGIRKRKPHLDESDESVQYPKRKVNPSVEEVDTMGKHDGSMSITESGATASGSIPPGDCDQKVGRILSSVNKFERKIIKSIRPIRKFYNELLHPPFRISHDLYSYMFLCDFINFFLTVTEFNAFGSSTGDSITKYFEENKVPIPLLVMIMVQFCSMIIDRALYLRKNIKFRLYFHILLVILIHFWLFFLLPSVTERKFTDLSAPKVWYIFKCVYFLMSSVQVKGGYPTRILGNTFTKKYSYFNLYLFKMYMLVPFLYDMRLIMDWIWTDTSLELDEWSIMEDIFKNLFQRKCELQFQESFPQFRGFPRRMYTKYMLGGLYLIMIIGAIWFPLVLFAVGGTVGSPNPPQDVMVEIEINGYVQMAKLSQAQVETSSMTETQYDKFIEQFKKKKEAVTFLQNYNYQDTSIVKLNGNSTPVWGISPSSLQALITDLSTSNNINMRVSWTISRQKQSKKQTMEAKVSKSEDKPMSERVKKDMVNMLNNTSPGKISVTLDQVFPNFLRVPEKGEPQTIRQLSIGVNNSQYRSLNITFKKKEGIQWFELNETFCGKQGDPYLNFIRPENEKDCDPSEILMVLINERVFPDALQVISGYGILGLYTTFVFVVSRIIRGLFDDISFKVIYTQMPNVDKVLQLCLDIYLVRESREFTLEEDLYGKLLFLYRSPETLIKWTKQKEKDELGNLHPPSK